MEPEALHLLQENGFTIPASILPDERRCPPRGCRYRWPVVLKVVSPQVIHKSDVGGVKVNVVGPEAVAALMTRSWRMLEQAVPEAFLRRSAGGTIGAAAGTELIIGMVRDPQFGPVIMFGLGGIFVEVFKDVSFRVAPFSREVALDMIKETRAARILEGVRGQKAVDVEALAQLLVKVSELAARYEDISEIDLNPVRVL